MILMPRGLGADWCCELLIEGFAAWPKLNDVDEPGPPLPLDGIVTV
jgi:hypothetical protein